MTRRRDGKRGQTPRQSHRLQPVLLVSFLGHFRIEMFPSPFLRLLVRIARIHEDLAAFRVTVHALPWYRVIELLGDDTVLEQLIALHAVAERKQAHACTSVKKLHGHL